jgi:hypothetical protein
MGAAKSAKERMQAYRARAKARGAVVAADDQDKQNARRARKRLAGIGYYDPAQKRAQNLVSAALRRNQITRQPCEICGSIKVEAHHDDYSKPLEVRWLCRVHHEEHHHA